MIDPAALNTEIATDPQTLGLTWSKENSENRALINAAGSASAAVDRTTVEKAELIEAIDRTEFESIWPTLDQWKKDLWTFMTTADLKISANTKAMVTGIWPVGATRTNLSNLTAISQAEASRSEELWGVLVSFSDLQAARP
jgi:hypothetical protein